MTTFLREAELKEPVHRYFARRSFRATATELQFYEYRVDLYAHSVRLGISIAVELKLSKWGRALRQALVYQLCADHVYIAMPAEVRHGLPYAQVEHYGIGVVLVYPTMCREVIAPRRSTVVRRDYLSFYRSQLLDGGVE